MRILLKSLEMIVIGWKVLQIGLVTSIGNKSGSAENYDVGPIYIGLIFNLNQKSSKEVVSRGKIPHPKVGYLLSSKRREVEHLLGILFAYPGSIGIIWRGFWTRWHHRLVKLAWECTKSARRWLKIKLYSGGTSLTNELSRWNPDFRPPKGIPWHMLITLRGFCFHHSSNHHFPPQKYLSEGLLLYSKLMHYSAWVCYTITGLHLDTFEGGSGDLRNDGSKTPSVLLAYAKVYL